MNKTILVQSNTELRLDTYLAGIFPEYSRSYFADLIRNQKVRLNGEISKASSIVHLDDEISIDFVEKEALSLTPAQIPLNIIYEDGNVVVINKQAGLVVHPAHGAKENTLVNALLAHFPDIKDAVCDQTEYSTIRPGLVQRLDKDTTGVMIIAKNSRAMHSLSRQIQNRTIKKTYVALCLGWPRVESGRLVNYLGRSPKNRQVFTEVGESRGKMAISNYKVREHYHLHQTKLSLIEFSIETGRTHQIRTQAKMAGFPIIGDQIYKSKESDQVSKKLGATRQLLHSKTLEITLPGESKSRSFSAKEPADFLSTVSILASVN